MSSGRAIRPSGDAALLVELGERLSPDIARRVRALDAAVAASRLPGLRERIPGYTTLLCEYDPLTADARQLAAHLAELRRAVLADGGALAAPAPGRTVRIPVAYGGEYGPDLAEVAALHALSEAEVVDRHAGGRYLVYFLGFSPGFAYMGEVDAAIATPRRAPPRTSVPAGSVAMAAAMTGVYPASTPGGWRILGRTPFAVYDPARTEPALFRQGDEVIFEPISPAAFAELAADQPVPQPQRMDGEPVFHVVRPGPLTTFQDLGRSGHQAAGVPVAGAADPPALRLANRLVGNADGAAALEITVMGPTLAALREVVIAVCGADLAATVDGKPLPTGQATLIRKGQELRFRGLVAGCRAYLAVAGGFQAPLTLGSASADLLGRLGPRPLRAGDDLIAGPAAARDVAGRRLRPGAYELPTGDILDVAVVPGPQEDWFPEAERLYAEPYAVLPASDRTGLRLDGIAVEPKAGDPLSEATPLGSIQVPADGRPIVLLAGRQTVGGYAKIGVVCTPDAWRLAQVRPGAMRVRFRPVGLSEAHQRHRAAQLPDGVLMEE
jgi:KipI family sensor histidine kinase inhibitor